MFLLQQFCFLKITFSAEGKKCKERLYQVQEASLVLPLLYWNLFRC